MARRAHYGPPLISNEPVWLGGGCSSFGHSCFGGHGKRADDDFPPPDYPNNAAPETELADKMPDSYKQPDIVPLLRQWLQLQAYRRLAEGNTN